MSFFVILRIFDRFATTDPFLIFLCRTFGYQFRVSCLYSCIDMGSSSDGFSDNTANIKANDRTYRAIHEMMNKVIVYWC